ncbi:hypothetical protein F4776DRAFT_668843 [Hypoxylon sp. NC0597]|nr:hypothetical protein F4776DRAFT_668843 [Hypoxylon sp. NC0597]
MESMPNSTQSPSLETAANLTRSPDSLMILDGCSTTATTAGTRDECRQRDPVVVVKPLVEDRSSSLAPLAKFTSTSPPILVGEQKLTDLATDRFYSFTSQDTRHLSCSRGSSEHITRWYGEDLTARQIRSSSLDSSFRNVRDQPTGIDLKSLGTTGVDVTSGTGASSEGEKSRHIPSVMVSDRPLDLNESPMVEPSHTHYEGVQFDTCIPPKVDSYESSESVGSQQFRVQSPVPSLRVLRPRRGETGMALWKYIQNYLVRTPLSPVPQHGHVEELLRHLTRVRDVEFNPHTQTPFNETRDEDISAMIIQVAGRKANTPCDRCKEEQGPFRGCYVIPTDVPLHLRQSFLSCANCHYNSQQACCNIVPWSLKAYPELAIVHPLRETPKQLSCQPKRCLPRDTKLPERRSLRIILKQTAPDYSTRSTPSRTQAARKQSKKIARSYHVQRPSPPPDTSDEMERDQSSQNSQNSDSSRTSATDGLSAPASEIAGDFNPARVLELETWEIAPGRVRDEEKDTIDNIAFSNAYLTQNHAVRISRDVSFQVITIKPGTVYEWQACTRSLRLCSVASGKLQVKMHNQDFLMGPNGMIRIRPGAGCVVMNRLYVDAMVHVTIVPSDLYG